MLNHEDVAESVETADNASEPTADIGNIDEEIDLTNLFEGEEEIEITRRSRLKTL